ncbi:galactoside 2-alpha-L-fucosyltransferase 1 isoform X2 [Eurytemora carolleeae]|uniref:galactoside 2-alpha-L-fucosyltransferase 1 isoform X2 n=2 Tax=Eurytemora carolleeae TaxID=1294199 RepID=UPI000C79439C|nr:galactoside 2-alpha-L-fucosyltransferase 1 isoform X2 [Eurytemora carolleeae]|eukprot:XP_023330071.1 galactoside 2-alpha-L-fucosyltransferase 1-like isoform X2 [Eurytemora affinis]
MIEKKYLTLLFFAFLTFLNLKYEMEVTVSTKSPKMLEHNNFECLVNQVGGCLLGTKTLYCTGPSGQLICGPRTSSVLKTECNGRLGNVMMAYATLLYLSKASKYGLTAILTKYQAEMMENAFQSDAYIFKEGIVDAKGPVEGIASMNEYGEYFYDSFLENINKYQFNKILDVGIYPSPFYLFYTIRDELKNHFQFHNEIQNAAFEAMEQSTVKIREKYNGKKIVKIAVHARRGDYLITQNEKLGIVMRDDEMWRKYFLYCINLFRNRIDNETTKTVFYMASEDTKWLKDNFGQEPDIGFPGEISNLPGIGFPGEISNLPGIGFPGEISNLPGIGFPGEISNLPGIGFPGEISNIPDQKMPPRDLFMLIQCDHMIRSYGTYGLWGGLWSTGTVMYATSGQHIVDEEHSNRINSSSWEAVDLNRFMTPTTTTTTTTTTTIASTTTTTTSTSTTTIGETGP